MADRFHKAARDGYLEVLKEATRKDLNIKDEDGMTPTLWASFEGNLDALRLIVGRGGDPDKCDNYGNTGLHFAAARGHMNCVSFLVNFGVNMWSLDIDFHTAKDLAAINSRDEILRFLDAAVAKEDAKEPKKVKAFKEKAIKDAEKRAKDFEKLQKKATKMQEEESKKLARARKEMEKGGGGGTVIEQSQHNQGPRPSMAFLSLRKDSRLIYASSPKFSEIVANQGGPNQAKTISGGHGKSGGVYKKVQQKKGMTVTGGNMKGPAPQPAPLDSDFKVGEMTDGKRSVRSLSGLRRDSEIMLVPKYDITSNNAGKRGKITGLFDDITNTNGDGDHEEGVIEMGRRGGSESPPRGGQRIRAGSISGIGLTRSFSQPDYMHQVGQDGELTSSSGTDPSAGIPSIFERPGFGSVAFRNSITATLSTFPNFSSNNPRHHQDSLGSEGKKSANGSGGGAWEEGVSDDDEDIEFGPVELFLAAAGLTKYIPIFLREKIDLEALMLLTEEDLKSMGIEMGPRRKLLKAARDRAAALEDPGEVVDSRL